MIKKAQVARYKIELERISSPMADTIKALSRKHGVKALPVREIDGRTLVALLSRKIVTVKVITHKGKTGPHAILTEKGQALRKAL